MESPEQNNIEYKSASNGRLQDDLWHTISAFSNSFGGKIYFGIDPEGNRLKLSAKEIDKLQADLANLCRTAFNVKIFPEIFVEDGIVVAVFEPAPASIRPVFHKKTGIEKGTYIRVGSSSTQADNEVQKRLIAASLGGVETNEFPYNWNDVLNVTAIEHYIELLNNRNDNIYQAFTTEEILVKQKVVSRDKSKVTLFGLLVFGNGRELQDIVAPTVNVAITQYPGVDKVDAANPYETFIDNKEFDGSVVEQYNSAFSYIKKIIPSSGVVVDGIRNDTMSIPEIAIREALANAIVHRDYSTYASRVQIDVFSNRIEIINPGNSLVPISELDTAPSTSRNPLLMNFMKDFGITDQKGRGIRTIVEAIKRNDLIDPEFSDSGKSFKVVLYSQSIFTAADREYIKNLGEALNPRQERAVAYALHHKDDGITNGLYRELNNMQAVRDDKKANRELNDLVDKKILKPVGLGKGRRYIIPS